MGLGGWALALMLAAGCGAGAQTAPRLTFEVASIHPTNPNETRGYIKPLEGGLGYSAQNMQVKQIVALMLKVPARQVTGGPGWLDSARFDIEARADHAYPVDDLHTMVMNLLADRFGLRFHMEKREGNVYALAVEKGGVKMKRDEGAEDFTIPVTFGPKGVIGRRVSMVYLTWFLGQALQEDKRPVIDQTGLGGKYDFTLSFRPVLPPDVPADTLTEEQQDMPTLFEAVREQLGLKLTAQRGPVPYYVVEAAHLPSEN